MQNFYQPRLGVVYEDASEVRVEEIEMMTTTDKQLSTKLFLFKKHCQQTHD
jgi:hypothetical protein